jgi:hypothetical protein
MSALIHFATDPGSMIEPVEMVPDGKRRVGDIYLHFDTHREI